MDWKLRGKQQQQKGHQLRPGQYFEEQYEDMAPGRIDHQLHSLRLHPLHAGQAQKKGEISGGIGLYEDHCGG